jgi:hypothetical protein
MSEILKMDRSHVLILGSVLFLLFAGGTAHAGVDEIKLIYQTINTRIVDKRETPISLYVDDNQGKEEWQRVVTQANQVVFDRSDFRAQVYSHEGKTVKAQIETTSESGDWKLTEEYYFYSNGRVAFYFHSLVTFQAFDYEHDQELPEGPYVVEKRFYFNEKGEPIRHLEKAFLQRTKKEVPVKYIRAELPVELYRDVKSLPFYKQIK